MRFSVGANDEPGTWEVDSARIEGRECAVVERHDAFPVGMAVYVLSDEARPGCGRPGSTVRLYRNRAPLAPAWWQPGVTGEVPVLLEGLRDPLPNRRWRVARDTGARAPVLLAAPASRRDTACPAQSLRSSL
jgi:hypothetical protein